MMAHRETPGRLRLCGGRYGGSDEEATCSVYFVETFKDGARRRSAERHSFDLRLAPLVVRVP